MSTTTVGLRELGEDASALVRRVENGEQITITVAGRERARLVPAQSPRWRTWTDIDDLFRGLSDQSWAEGRELVDDNITDPWERL